MPAERRDVFIIHTQGDEHEARLVEELKDTLDPLGVYAYGYEDWEWEAERVRREWRSSGTRLDPLRYVARDPRPFEHHVTESLPDREALADIFEHSRLVVFIAPRAVEAAPGVAVELEVLLRDWDHPSVLAVSWWDENDALIEDAQPFHNYRVRHAFDKLDEAAREVAEVVWVACALDALFNECAEEGRRLVIEMAKRDRLLARMFAWNPRRPEELRREVERAMAAAGEEGQAVNVTALVEESDAESCAAAFRFWRGGASLHATRLSYRLRDQDLRRSLHLLTDTLRDFCLAVEDLRPAAAAPHAETLLSLATVEVKHRNERRAHQHFTEALELNPPPAARDWALHNRALAREEMKDVDGALADLTRVIEAADASPLSVSGALVERARLRAGRGDHAGAASDATRAVSMEETPPAARAAALLRRAASRQHTGDDEGALADYTEVAALRKHVAPVLRASALLQRAGLHLRVGRTREALDDFGKVTMMREATPQQHLTALFHGARAKAETGDADGARRDYTRLLDFPQLDPTARAEVEALRAALADGAE